MFELRPKKKLSSKGLFFLKAFFPLLLVLIFLSSRLSPIQGENRFISFFQNILYPFEYAFNESHVFVTSSLDRYWFHVSLFEENEVLRLENDKLKAQLLDYNEL